MQTRLLKYLNNHNILVQEQYGFRANLKTDDATFHLTNQTLNALNNNSLVGAIFCDLEKAFDCVNHKILLTKFKFYGITDIHYKLYKSYFTACGNTQVFLHCWLASVSIVDFLRF
jgi:hypothetical protein